MNTENNVVHPTTNKGEYLFWCSGCNEVHAIQTHGNGYGVHEFNGDLQKPTFKLKSGAPFTVYKDWYCCLTITNGIIRYLGCKHILSGFSTEMRERKDWESFNIQRNPITGNFEADFEK